MYVRRSVYRIALIFHGSKFSGIAVLKISLKYFREQQRPVKYKRYTVYEVWCLVHMWRGV